MPGTRRTSLKERHKRGERFNVKMSKTDVFTSRGLLSLTDLDSSEDTVYVVLSTDQHGWRRDRRFTVIVASVSAAGRRGTI